MREDEKEEGRHKNIYTNERITAQNGRRLKDRLSSHVVASGRAAKFDDSQTVVHDHRLQKQPTVKGNRTFNFLTPAKLKLLTYYILVGSN
jgi:hypothetical protein